MAFISTINTSVLTTYLIRKFIPTLENELQHQKFTTPAIIPPGQGKIGRFNVFSNPPGNTTGFEASTTAGAITTLTTTGTDCTIAEYGEFIQVGSLQMIAAVKNTRDQISKRMAYGGAFSLDKVVREAAKATTTKYSCAADGLAASTTKPTAMTLKALMSGGEVLRSNSNIGFTGVAGHPDGAMAAILSTQAELDMVTEGTTGHITWQNAVVNVPGMDAQKRWVKGYMGECYGIACYRTQSIEQVTVTSLTDSNFLYGEGGMGAVAFNDMNATIIVNDVNSPYKNLDSIAWHAYFGTALIDVNRVVKLYSLNA